MSEIDDLRREIEALKREVRTIKNTPYSLYHLAKDINTPVTADDVSIADAGGIITATDVEGALQENRTALNLNTTHRTGDGSDHADVSDNTTHRTSNGTDHTYINQDLRTSATPTFEGLDLYESAATVYLKLETDQVNGSTIQRFLNDAKEWQIGITGADDSFYIADTGITGEIRVKVEPSGMTLTNDLTVTGDASAANLQDLATTDSPTFAGLTTTGNITSGGDINLNGFDFKAGTFSSIADDNFVSFTPYTSYGILFLYQLAGANINGIVVFRANASPWGAKMLDTHSVIEIATTSLNGTTGTNGKFTVGVTNGTLYLENRLGSTATVGYFTIGY